jgi:hypothetical protein
LDFSINRDSYVSVNSVQLILRLNSVKDLWTIKPLGQSTDFLNCALKEFFLYFFPLDGGRKEDGGESLKTTSSALRKRLPPGEKV